MEQIDLILPKWYYDELYERRETLTTTWDFYVFQDLYYEEEW